MTTPAALEDLDWPEDAVATIIGLALAQPTVTADDLARELRPAPHGNMVGPASPRCRPRHSPPHRPWENPVVTETHEREHDMSTEIDPTAKLTTESEVAELVAKLHAAEDERDKAKRACQTLGRIIERDGVAAVAATNSQDLIGEDGDGDWQAVWDRVTELGESARQADARAIAAEAKVGAVRDLHKEIKDTYWDSTEWLPWSYCEECSDMGGDGSKGAEMYPCPTIAALEATK